MAAPVITRQTPTGLNVSPGDSDDGWQTPPPVALDDDTQIQLFKDGEALLAGFEAIRLAKRKICLEVYIFADDKTGRAFAELLAQRARDGLEVRVIFDSFGSLATDREMFREMHAAGVHLRQFHPIRFWETKFSWRPLNRDHRKLLVIDDQIAGLGGLNIGKEYAGSWVIRERDPSGCNAWRDNAISVHGPGATRFQQAFDTTWNYLLRNGPLKRAEYMHNIECLSQPTRDRCQTASDGQEGAMKRPDGPTEAGPPRTTSREPNELAVLASAPTPNSPLRDILHGLFHQARQSIQMTMAYFAPDDDLIDTLCRAARRGVKVQLMLPGVCDVKLLLIAARSFYEKLLLAGVEIYERQEVILHAKTMTIDGKIVIIGSTNLDYRSIEWNLELSAIVRSETFGAQMHELFQNDIRYAKQIIESQWHDRPWLDRLTQWIVSRARYLL